ncbi:MAG: hypothetical protein HOQ24_15365 [Mycobacteriaceae bacterium]|nr:hypothetical protein [Mycobacteriaceae bacterium]
MPASDDFLSGDIPKLDAHSSLSGIGPIEMHHPTVSLGGDGKLDSETIQQGDELIVASDLDHNGEADHLKVIDADGEFSAWEYQHDDAGGHWVQTDHGHL